MKFLKFDETRDFPFYKHNPRVPKLGWFLLLLSVFVSYIIYGLVGSISGMEIIAALIFCVIMLIPLLYFLNWDYTLIFRKPTKNELILACILFVTYIIYSLCVTTILDTVVFSGAKFSAASLGINVGSTFGLIFSIMGEELLKFIPLMFLMRIVYKFSSNLKLAVTISTIIVLLGFAFLHYDPGTNNILSILLLQGLGSMFEMYGYLKTKNLFVSYLAHLMIDVLSFVIVMLGG